MSSELQRIKKKLQGSSANFREDLQLRVSSANSEKFPEHHGSSANFREVQRTLGNFKELQDKFANFKEIERDLSNSANSWKVGELQ